MIGKNFQIYGVKITGKCIYESKNWIFSLLFMPQANFPLRSHHHLPDKKKLSISQRQRFVKIYFPQHKGEKEDIMELRKRPKLNLRGWFKHAKCEGFNLTNIILTKKYSVKE